MSSHKKKKKSEISLLLETGKLLPYLDNKSKLDQKHQLTGIPREIKDHCADWHNYIVRWNELNSQGTAVVKTISNSIIASKDQNKTESSSETGDSCTETNDRIEELQKFSENLIEIFQKMLKLLIKMESKTEKFKALLDLSNIQNSITDNSEPSSEAEPVFYTWTVDKFYATSLEMLQMFKKEADLKRVVIENLAFSSDRDMLLMMTAAWSYEPYLEETLQYLLQSMLLETGFQTL